MIFEQKENKDVIMLGYKDKNTPLQYPEVGKIYNAFDDGKISFSRLIRYKITEKIDLDNNNTLSAEELNDIKEEIYNTYWLYDREQHIIYRGIALNDDNDEEDKDIGPCFFLKTQQDDWFGACCDWWCSLLDVDGSIYKNLEDSYNKQYKNNASQGDS